MTHSFSTIIVNNHHWADPFSCHCHDHGDRREHSLTVGQRVAAIAISVITGVFLLSAFPPLLAVPLFFGGGALSFYSLCAYFKARNVVWLDYRTANPTISLRLFNPFYWGIRGLSLPNRRHDRVVVDRTCSRDRWRYPPPGENVPSRPIGGGRYDRTRVPVGSRRRIEASGRVVVGGGRRFR